MLCEKDKVEYLTRLADASWREYSERRSVEWKVNFGLWAALGTFAGFVFQQDKIFPLWITIATSLILLCTFLIYTFLWKAEIQVRNSLDKKAAQDYWKKVDEMLNVKSPEVRTRHEAKRGWRITHLSQVAITILFLLLAILAVWAPQIID